MLIATPHLPRTVFTTVFELLIVGVLAAISVDGVFADEPNADPSPFLATAKKYDIEVAADHSKLTLQEKSVLNWTNPVRSQERGAVFVWLYEGRPLTIGSLFTYVYNEKVFEKHEFQSLSTMPLRSTYDGTLAWAPNVPGLEWRVCEDSPEPGKTHTSRLLQMRQLARPFRAELLSPKDEKTELRLVSRPLFEYSSPKNAIIDGAIFSYAVATDPEVLMLIEAIDETKAGVRRNAYRYAFARFHYWNVAVYEEDKMIWDAPLDMSHEMNVIGDRMNMEKIYNSYRPTR